MCRGLYVSTVVLCCIVFDFRLCTSLCITLQEMHGGSSGEEEEEAAAAAAAAEIADSEL